ncbi:MAG: tetratricopeptide repeat protein [Gammaproteobacteria bacterium]
MSELKVSGKEGEAQELVKKGLALEEQGQTKQAYLCFEFAAAKQRCIEAYYHLGRCYECGIGIASDEKKAKKYYTWAAEAGHLTAQSRLEGMEERAFFTQPNFKERMNYYKTELKKSGQFNQLGRLYEIGFNDIDRAMKYYEQADNKIAEYHLGRCYEREKRNYVKAVQHYFKAGRHAEALNNLGRCYEYGFGVEQNIRQAILHYSSAAELRDPAALNNLGRCYEYGIEVKQNLQQAMNFYKAAIRQGCIVAEYNIGRHNRDLFSLEAINTHQSQAAFGYAEAQNNLGKCYAEGIGVKKDMQLAIDYHRLAANQDHPDALYTLGFYCQQGKSLSKDPLRAVKCYLLAADQFHREAQFQLGQHFENRSHPDYYPERALRYYKAAAQQRDALALNRLGEWYEKGICVAVHLETAVQCYRASAEQNYKPAVINLGRCYEHGIGIERDDVNAWKYYYTLKTPDLLLSLLKANPSFLFEKILPELEKLKEKSDKKWLKKVVKKSKKFPEVIRAHRIVDMLHFFPKELHVMVLEYEKGEISDQKAKKRRGCVIS